jgi:hypothetical protein
MRRIEARISSIDGSAAGSGALAASRWSDA